MKEQGANFKIIDFKTLQKMQVTEGSVLHKPQKFYDVEFDEF